MIVLVLIEFVEMKVEMKVILDQIAQPITTQKQAAIVQAQDMTAQENREISPRAHQYVSTMASHLRDFTRINHPIFYGSKFEEYPQEFIDEVYKILYSIGVSLSEKAELATYRSKDIAQTWHVQCRDNRPLRGGPVTWEIF